EALGPVVACQADLRADGLANARGDRLRAPGPAVDERLVVRAECRVKSKERRVAARREDVSPVARVHDAIARHAVRRAARAVELLAAHRRPRIPPDLADDHGL